MKQTITSGRHTFEVVTSVPYGYVIWNIGKNMIDGYLPLVQTGGYDGCQIVGTMKAIKIEGAQTILEAIGGGQRTVKQMETYVKRYKNAKAGTWSHCQAERMKKALLIMYTIDGISKLH